MSVRYTGRKLLGKLDSFFYLWYTICMKEFNMDKQDELYQMEIDHLTDIAIKSHMLINKIYETANRSHSSFAISILALDQP